MAANSDVVLSQADAYQSTQQVDYISSQEYNGVETEANTFASTQEVDYVASQQYDNRRNANDEDDDETAFDKFLAKHKQQEQTTASVSTANENDIDDPYADTST